VYDKNEPELHAEVLELEPQGVAYGPPTV